ncbi:molybdopterin-dependent oxidoreductase [Oceanibaculum indicum]|uniref:Aldehyde oxidase/xanthine dehydrogenase n=1 Tax=Oceanibaculum indicum P24 TaxID=1207063 RepID=K2KBN7_9PROT|nr:molybdopterin cofactor-binding domain-containing protein [Oceanibaculum indicum]EKE74780.1 aldehyde oxidase/xanthine dehydrogenase [Oceanibaculum indicum P24]
MNAPIAMSHASDSRIRLTVNGQPVTLSVPPGRRLTRVLRDNLGLTGTKVGCDAGDCGACTVLMDGRQVCACLVPAAQANGTDIVTVEGLAEEGRLNGLQQAFHRHGAAQCGICTPGMLMAASELLAVTAAPTRQQVEDALGGVLCRCTGYRKIVDAVLDAGASGAFVGAKSGAAVGARIPRKDGIPKLTGEEKFGADEAPADALWLRAIRSPHAHARFTLGDLDAFRKNHPGIERIFTAADVPGSNSFGIYPDLKDQPVLADGYVRFRGEAVLALVGDRAALEGVAEADIPIVWQELPALIGTEAALAEGAAQLHAASAGNVLIRGHVARGDLEAGFANAVARTARRFETSYVEHAYIEPEAGFARRVGGRMEITACTQTPYMDRDEVAHVLGIAKADVRIIPTATGGGFGGKLDMSVQPLLATAAWLLERPVRMIYHRPESMASTTKRHPATIAVEAAADAEGKITAFRFHGDFDTGAYASWGPTVANRVPVHATGPYKVGAALCTSRAVYTNGTPSGAFRGFGVPQAAIAHEAAMDDLALALGIDRLEFRHLNALRAGEATHCGQIIEQSVGMAACLEALRPRWRALVGQNMAFNAAEKAKGGPLRRGVGVGCMWYGCGNTSMSNPSTMRIGLKADGRLTLYNGAHDIGQGSYTIMAQIAADALGLPVGLVEQIYADTDRTADAGKTSASRQTFVSGKAAELAGLDLRATILRLANAGPESVLSLDGPILMVAEGVVVRRIDLREIPVEGQEGDVLTGEGTFDPPTSPLDENGQGVPYATYAFAAQIAEVEVDIELGTVKPLLIAAAHDVGRSINPMLVEGQIQGGIAQGLGLALMEEFIPGRTENLHDYLIPTFGDVPDIEMHLIEDAEPLGPYGAKGIGEPALVPTAPAILGAIRDATGAVVAKVPALPHRVLKAIREAEAAQ